MAVAELVERPTDRAAACEMLELLVLGIRLQAPQVRSIELAAPDGAQLPAFDAGAHIDLHFAKGMVRSYSLLNAPWERDRYVVAVLRDPMSRGGSQYLHEQLQVGDRLRVSVPRNHFPLDEGEHHSVLIAGGIGVTPILCMGRRLQRLGRSFEVIYLARSRQGAAYRAELAALGVPVREHFDDVAGAPPDLRGLLRDRARGQNTHFYACGPGPMLDAFLATCRELGHTHTHVERFSGAPLRASAKALNNYTVELRRSGQLLQVTPAKSLLDTLLDANVRVEHNCEQGYCGSCETRLLEGIAEHRDTLLTDEQRASNQSMMVCVSGARSERLVLDL